ncbi:hypothetical protein [Phytoactinopolyspora limicola]|uniref:hypothetical protein n=1 Tax=Phytoactinopolyspora limicola TaxID=2715536 RepID=UPI00140CC018|nr:hypothetical protein [Phytoactinopolyspora limicola]
MKPAVRRGVLVSIPALAFLIGGCSVHEQTQGWHPRYDGVTGEAGDIGLRNVVVVVSDDSRATVLSSFANRGAADELLEVRVGEVTAVPPSGSLEIPDTGYAALEPGPTQIEFDGVDVGPGRITEVEFQFANAPRVTLDAVVKGADGRYAHVEFSENVEADGAPLNGADDPGDDDPGDDDSADED